MFPLLRAAMLAQVASAALSCGGRFQKISAWEFAAGLNPGWNAGNTLDAIPAETSWGQQPLTNQTFTNAKNKGFRGIRIPGECTHGTLISVFSCVFFPQG